MSVRVIGGRNRRIVFTHSAGDSTDTATYTFNSVSFGIVSPRRHIIVGFQAGQTGANINPPDSVTIGGVAASLVISNPAGVGTAWSQLWIAAVPTGTSGSVVVTRPGTMSSGAIAVWAAYDLQSATAFDTASNSGTTSTLDLDTPGNGIIAGFARETGAGVPTFTWSGLTEDVDTDFAGDTVRFTGASAMKVAAATPRSISVTADGVNSVAGVAASFR